MSGNSVPPKQPAEDSSLDYETIRSEIDDLDAEIRSDASRFQIHSDSSALIELSRLKNSLNVLVRQWRPDPDFVTEANVRRARILLTTYHGALMEQESQFPRLRNILASISSAYDKALDQVSVFLTVRDFYERKRRGTVTGRDFSLEEVVADTKAMVTSRRELITAIDKFRHYVVTATEQVFLAAKEDKP